MNAPVLPGVPQFLRAHNDRTALELFLNRGQLTRGELGELTGLSRVTAGQVVDRLEQRRLIRQVGERSPRRGPVSAVYGVVASSSFVVGVEVGPKSVVAACTDITGTVAGQVELSTLDSAGPRGAVASAVTRAATEAEVPMAKVRRVVLGAPNGIDPATGRAPVADELVRWRECLGPTVTVDSEANLAAVAEAAAGAARGVRTFALLWCGRSVGLALMLNGVLHRGARGAAGDFGHLPVSGTTVPCGVPRRRRGGFRDLVSGNAVRALAREHGFPAGSAADAVSAAVYAGARGDAMLDELARRLAFGVAATSAVLDPPLVLLAGEVGRAGGAVLTRRLQRAVATIVPAAPQLALAEVEELPVLRGAVLTAIASAREELLRTLDTSAGAG
jgi:predicted NBD/HSP70 family sugar kinase